MGSSEGELFGDLLRKHRSALEWSQEELAWRAGVHVHTITNLERGQTRAPQRSTVIKFAKALELDDKARDNLLAARDRLAGRTHPPKTAYGTPRPNLLNVPPLKGRDDEHAQIRDLLVKNGPPVLVLIGEPGIGKTRLLIDAADQGEQYGWIVMRGEAHRDEGQHPFAPIYQALHRHLASLTPTQHEQALATFTPMLGLFPELVRPGSSPVKNWQPTPDQERRLMFNSVAQYFAHLADSNGVLLILDDLQWAQPDALTLLKALLRNPDIQRTGGLCVVAAVRSGGSVSNAALRATALDLDREGLIVRSVLGPLSDEGAAQLVEYTLGVLPTLAPDDRAELVRRIVKRAAGLPFFLTRLASDARQNILRREAEGEPSVSLDERIPNDITEMAHQRIATLPAAASDVLALAAVFGRETPLAALTLTSQRPATEVVEVIEAACEDQLLYESSEGVYAFKHDLVREAILAGLTSARRTLLHHRIAKALEAQPTGDMLDALAFHYGKTTDVEKAIFYLERAGDHARAMHATDAAERYYRQALRRLERSGRADQTVARVQEKLGALLTNSARYRDALAPLESAARLCERAGDLDGAGRAVAQIAWAHVKGGEPEEAMAHLQPALAPINMARLSVGTQAALWRAHAATLFTLNRYAEQLESAHRACACARQTNDTAALAQGLRMEALALGMLGRIPESIALSQETIRLARAADDLETYSAALSDTASMRRARGELRASWELSKLALKAIEPLGDPMATAFFSSAHGVDDFLLGDWRNARKYMQKAVSVAAEIGPSWVAGYPLADLGTLNLAEGHIDVAHAQLEKALKFATERHDLQAQRIIQAPLAEHDLLHGDARGAIRRLEPLIDHSGHGDKESAVLLPLLSRAYVANGQLDLAARALEECQRQATASGVQLVLLDALLARATLHSSHADWSQAAALLNQAVAQAHAMEHPYAEAKAQSLYASVLARRGDIAGARAAYGAALQRFRTLGERLYARIAEAEFQALNGPNSSPGPSSPQRFV